MGIKAERCKNIVSKNYYVTHKFDELGFSHNYMAFYYLVDLSEMFINKRTFVKSFSKDVYPEIAQKYNKTPCTVERDIRKFIQKFWNDALKEKLDKFWSSEKRPSCKEFIFILKNYLLEGIS